MVSRRKQPEQHASPDQPQPTDPDVPAHPGFDPDDDQPPIVTITSPLPADSVSGLTPIIGTVDDPEDNLWYYRVLYARADRVSLFRVGIDPEIERVKRWPRIESSPRIHCVASRRGIQRKRWPRTPT